MISPSIDSKVRFHLSLNVASIQESIDFFSKVFGMEPAKQRADYAKFELENPLLSLALEPHPPARQGALNHAGFRLETREDLVELQRRLELAGISTEREEGVECCYSKQTKFWLHDPDGNLWEFYVLEEDIEHRGAGQVERLQENLSTQEQESTCRIDANKESQTKSLTLQHRLANAFPKWSELVDDSCETIQFQGTFNDELFATGEYTEVLREARRVLQPGGRLVVHNLTTMEVLSQTPTLPGPASVVKHVPQLSRLLDALLAAGFEDIRLTKFSGTPCFAIAGKEMRETMIEGFASDGNPLETCELVVYRGPLAAIELDGTCRLERGIPTQLSSTQWNRLERVGLLDQVIRFQMTEAHREISCTG